MIASISANISSLLNNGEIKNYDHTSNVTSKEFNYFLFVSFLETVILFFSFYDVVVILSFY